MSVDIYSLDDEKLKELILVYNYYIADTERSKAEKKFLDSQIEISHQSPDEFAYNLNIVNSNIKKIRESESDILKYFISKSSRFRYEKKTQQIKESIKILESSQLVDNLKELVFRIICIKFVDNKIKTIEKLVTKFINLDNQKLLEIKKSLINYNIEIDIIDNNYYIYSDQINLINYINNYDLISKYRNKIHHIIIDMMTK